VTVKSVSNLAASVQARLQNRARASKRPFQELLQYYAMERFLYRLSQTPHRARFVLKGALILHVWDAPLARATKDIDFLGRLDNALENLERVIREVCAADVDPDGMVFDPATVKTERIKEDADYEGVRVRFVGLLGKARVAMQLDVGFGDVVTPGAQDITYPVLLDFPAPALAGYPRETVVAEKFQAMVYLRTLNSRMKDFYDVWLLASQFAFDGAVLAQAIAATFANRETAIDVAPIAFTPDFTEQVSTLAQWTAFRKKLPNTECPGGSPMSCRSSPRSCSR
jgi:nucleotidyltransferase AbiEii toxin of type IV toxin-antitoxin system